MTIPYNVTAHSVRGYLKEHFLIKRQIDSKSKAVTYTYTIKEYGIGEISLLDFNILV